jgi:hypothetical protein
VDVGRYAAARIDPDLDMQDLAPVVVPAAPEPQALPEDRIVNQVAAVGLRT